MNRTAWLQDRRMQKFRDVLSRWERKELSAQEAGEILGCSERQFRRYRQRYEEDGLAGLVDRRLGKASVKRVPVDSGPLVATASPPGMPGAPFPMLVSTGSSLTLLAGPLTDHPATQKEGFDLLDPDTSALRGSFRNVSLLKLPLSPAGDGSVQPGGILAGDILRNYSVDILFGDEFADIVRLHAAAVDDVAAVCRIAADHCIGLPSGLVPGS